MINHTAQLAEEGHPSIANQMGRWVEQVLGKSFHKYCPGDSWTPAVNLYEDAVSYLIVVDLAGLRTEDIDLRVEKNVLVLSGERQTPTLPDTSPPVRVKLMEIDHGPFCRSIELPADANLEAVQACYRGGFLWIRVAKRS